MRRGIAYLSFTEEGRRLADRLSAALGGETCCARDRADFSLSEWTKEMFSEKEALVFVGAAGIAVRAVAPFLKSKAEDPAVVCLDETGRFVIPLVSGHLGGANGLAGRIAAVCGGDAAVTTATDVRGVFAADSWAKRQGLSVLNPERIKTVSAKLLAGGPVTVSSPFPVEGEPPAGVLLTEGEGDAAVTFRPREDALCLVPRCLTLGVGCRRGTAAEALETAFSRFCGERGVLPGAVGAAATVSLKKDEEGLLAFCREHGWPLSFFSAGELAAAPGDFTPSPFVEKTVGVDNVCERSAVLASGGELIERKYAADGVTFALALTPPRLDWRW